MRGWVYIISNKSMPGLVKVGYSTKDPEERAKELDHTGTPHPYVVEYDILIEGELHQVEQHIHHNLSPYYEGKEWFRCTPEQAVIAIRQVAKEIAIAESFKKAEREKAETLEREIELEIAKQQEKRKIMAEIIAKEREMTKKYEDFFKDKSTTPGIKFSLKSWLAERKKGKEEMSDEYKQKMSDECRLLIRKAKRRADLSCEQGNRLEAQGSYSEALNCYKMAVTIFSNVSQKISELKEKIH
jgi:DNA-binding protein H-NS